MGVINSSVDHSYDYVFTRKSIKATPDFCSILIAKVAAFFAAAGFEILTAGRSTISAGAVVAGVTAGTGVGVTAGVSIEYL